MLKNDIRLPENEARKHVQRDSMPALFTLTRWQVRSTWWILLMISGALLAAFAIACIAPLFPEVADTAGLEGLFNAVPAHRQLALTVDVSALSPASVQNIYQQYDHVIRPAINPYLESATARVITVTKIPIIEPESLDHVNPLNFYASSIERLKSGLHLSAGRWPDEQFTNNTIEIMLTTGAARSLGLSVGSTITVQTGFLTSDSPYPVDPRNILHLHLVGLFAEPSSNVPALFGETFQQLIQENGTEISTVLLSDKAFLQACDYMAQTEKSDSVFPSISQGTFHLAWYYQLATNKIQVSDIDNLTSSLALAEARVSGLPTKGEHDFPFVKYSQFAPLPSGDADIGNLLNQYTNKMAVVHLTIMLLALQIIALLLFFACLLANMLIDRQMIMNALLSSRGASRGQIFWSAAIQGIVLCLLTLLIGPLLGIMAVYLLARYGLPSNEQAALTLLFSSYERILLAVGPYISGTLLLALLGICLPFRRSPGTNILELRRETARTERQPFWLRYYLDILVAILALSGLGVTFYLANTARGLDTATQALIIAPLTIVAPLLLLLAALLLFLRGFPAFLRLATALTRSTRGAAAMLSLAQMGRAPRQNMRMIILLSLAIAFVLFSLCFTASQNQRTLDVSAYETGADFAGNLPASLRDKDQSDILSQYDKLPGVLKASAGYTAHAVTTGIGNSLVNMQLLAVDDSFPQVGVWGPQYSSQSLDELLKILHRYPVSTGNFVAIPAIVDKTTLSALHIKQGDVFVTDFKELGSLRISFQATAVVEHIPTINGSADVLSSASTGGLLVDYTMLRTLYHAPLNYIWLRSDNNPKIISALRSILNSPDADLGLSNLLDRRELADELQHDPLFVAIVLIFSIGGGVVFILALLGNMLIVWLSIRQRRTSFIMLRALGMNRGQVLATLLWEQGIVYCTALLLALGLGAALIWLVIPRIVFTGLPMQGSLSEVSSSQFYLLQHILPPQIVFPPTLLAILLAVVLVCAFTLLSGVMIIQRPSAAQELRLNED